MLEDLVIGKKYEVKTKDFQRPFVGEIKEIFEDYVLVEVEHCELIDQEKFKLAFNKGIGRSRSYGCGLLQILPIS